MKLHATDFEGPGPFTVMAVELDEPKDDWTDTISLSEFRALPAGRCPLHGPACGGTEARDAEITRAIYTLDGVRNDHLLRREAGVAAGPSGTSHVFYFKFDANGLTYRVGAMRDLVRFSDYMDWTCRPRSGVQSTEPVRLVVPPQPTTLAHAP